MTSKPRILLTNDDGLHAPGLQHLWKGLCQHAELIIVAPVQEQSGVGLSITTRTPLHIHEHEVVWGEKVKAWSINGTPADCVKMALSILLESPPDLIVSGINRGSNAGRNLLYSGTVGGVIEGVFRDIQGIAFSCESFTAPNYHLAQKHVLKVVQYILNHPLPSGTLLNVNFPSNSNEIKGFRLAKQGRGYWVESPDCRQHPQGATYFWLGGKHLDLDEDEESDVALLQQGYVTAVPVQVGELTDYAQIQARSIGFEKFFM